jgi:hypothetical protein
VGNWTDGGNWITETCSSCLYVDIDRDGTVGASDLLVLLTAWGTCPPRGDVTGDGITSSVDLLALLVNWGPCP